MAFKALHERVDDAFASEGAQAFGERYLDILLQTWRDVTVSLRRTGSLLAVLIVGFLLLIGAKESAITLGPFKLTDLTAVLVLAPAAVAHLLYEFAALLVAFSTYHDLRLLVVRKLHPSIEDNDLEAAIAPGSVALWGQDSWRILRTRSPGPLARVEDLFSSLILGAIFVQHRARRDAAGRLAAHDLNVAPRSRAT